MENVIPLCTSIFKLRYFAGNTENGQRFAGRASGNEIQRSTTIVMLRMVKGFRRIRLIRHEHTGFQDFFGESVSASLCLDPVCVGNWKRSSIRGSFVLFIVTYIPVSNDRGKRCRHSTELNWKIPNLLVVRSDIERSAPLLRESNGRGRNHGPVLIHCNI